jgi:hemerythrin
MSLFDWKDSYKFGITEIDNQHQKLFGIINHLYDLMRQSQAEPLIKSILQELIDYAAYHFSTEEKYFIKFHYADIDKHIKEHLSYKQKVSDLILKTSSENGTIPFALLNFLTDWWVNHIIGVDRHYVKCFKDNGLT